MNRVERQDGVRQHVCLDAQVLSPYFPARGREFFGPESQAAETSGLSDAPMRSEEHTSELQSHSDLVCRLLLEKKNRVGRARWLALDCDGGAHDGMEKLRVAARGLPGL